MARRFGLVLLEPDPDRHQSDLADLAAMIALLLRSVGGIISPPATPIDQPGHIETRVDGNRVWTPEGLAPENLSRALMEFWPRAVWTDAARVSYHESAWSSRAVNDTRWRGGGSCGVRYWYSDEVGWATTEYSVGFYQINICAHGHDFEYWEDTRNNVRKGAELYAAEGWRPWTVTARRLRLLT